MIKYLINSRKVFVFIVGTPEDPMCKYSKSIINYLNNKNVDYGYYNIMINDELAEKLKEFSNWKTFPQLFIDGKLIGGNDIVLEMEELG